MSSDIKDKFYSICNRRTRLALFIVIFFLAGVFSFNFWSENVLAADGPNLLTNGDFEATPFDTGWSAGTGGGASFTVTTTAAFDTAQASLCTFPGGQGGGCVFSQGINGQIASDPFNLVFSARAGADTATSTEFQFILTNDKDTAWTSGLTGFTECLNTNTWEWVSATSSESVNYPDCVAHFTVESGDLSTSTYTEFDIHSFGIDMNYPASGEIGITFIDSFNEFSGAGDTVMIDEVELYSLEHGMLPTVDTDSKTKLIWTNNTYYYAFSSSTAGTYNVYLATSTSGVAGTWSVPQLAFEGIKPTCDSEGCVNGLFAFEYNSFGNYFGLAAYASSSFAGPGTNEGDVWFTSSTDGVTWSATSTLTNWLTDDNPGINVYYRRKIFLDFSEDENFAVVAFTTISSEVGVYYSSNSGASWSAATTYDYGLDGNVLSGVGVSGSGASRRIHLGHTQSPDSGMPVVIYASSTDNVGTSWTTTTVDSVGLWLPDMESYLAFDESVSFAVDVSGAPAFNYHVPTAIDLSDFGVGNNFPTTSTVVYATKSSGSWVTSTVDNISYTLVGIDAIDFRPTELFFNSSIPILGYVGDDFEPSFGVNTSTSFYIDSPTTTAMGYVSDMGVAYSDTRSEIALSFVSSGQLYFATSSLTLPSVPSTPANFVLTPATSSITLSWDAVVGADSYYVESSLDISSSTTNTSFTYFNLISNTNYFFRVSAVNEIGASTPSDVTSTYTLTIGNYLKNNSFEGWNNNDTDPNIPDDFFTQPYGDGGSPTSSESLVSRTGDASIFMDDDSGSSLMLIQEVSDLAPSTTITVSAWAKHSVGDHVSIFVTNDALSPSLIWNFTSGAWESIPEVGPPTADEIYTYQLTSTDWEEVNTNNASNRPIVPENGIVAVYFLNADSDLYLDDVSLTVNGVPNAPTNFTIDNAGPGIFDLSWTDNATDEDGFVLGVSTDGVNFTYYDYGGYGPNTTALSKDELIANQEYWLKIAAYNAYGTSTYAVLNNVFTTPNLLAAPEVSNVSTSSLNLSWDNSYNSTATVYYVGYNGGFVTTTATSTTVTGLTPNTEYQFAVRSEYLGDPGTYTAYSVSSTATTTLAVVGGSAPTAPSGLTVDSVHTTNADLFWTDNANDEDGFDFGVSTDGMSFTSSLLPAGSTTTTLITLNPNTPYWFRVAAYNTYGTSTYATLNEVYTDATTPGTPAVSSVSTSSLLLIWSGNSNGSGTIYYILYGGGSVTTTATTTSITGLTPNTSYQFQVRAQYLSDGISYTDYSASSTATTTLSLPDSTPPDAPVISTSPQTTNAANISISGTAEADSTVYITGGATTATGTATGGNFSISVSLTQDAVNTLSAVAVDASGNTSTADTVAITEDSTAPSAPSLTTTATTTDATSINVVGTAEADALITITGGAATATGTASGGNFSISVSLTQDATNTLSVTASDAVNNTSTPATVVIVEDSTAPTVAAVTVVTTPTNDTTPSYTFSSTEAGTISYGGSCSSGTTVASSGNNTISFSTLAEGTYSDCTITVTDALSHASNVLGVATFVVDTTAPSAPSINSVVTGTTTSTIYWDTVSGASTYTVSSTAASATSTSNTSTSFSSLTANASYSFQVKSLDAATNSSSYSDVTSTYTNAAVPTSVSASATGQTSITVSWSANSNSANTVYKLVYSNETLIATTTATSYSVTGLSANTSYTFKVAALYKSDETTYSSYSSTASATTNSVNAGGGSGGTDTTPPTDISISINNGATSTTNTAVTLTLGATGASQMLISNSSGFASTYWEPFVRSKSWTLTPGEGTKYVYVVYKDSSNNVSIVISDSIRLFASASTTTSTPATTTPGQTVTSTPIVVCPLSLYSAYKTSGSPAVYYITKDCTKRAFRRSDVFFTYFKSWSDVQTTTSAELSSIPNDVLGFMPWGPLYNPKYGALVKITSDARVYLLLNDKKYWITSESVFNALNYQWNWIEDIDERLLAKYESQGEITETDHHQNYTIIKYPNSSKVYRLEANPTNPNKQVKRWIADEYTFNSLNFRWDRIVTVPLTEVYTEGETLLYKFVFTKDLKTGDINEDVRQLQTKLKNLGYFSYPDITNKFGAATREAVLEFQKSKGLSQSGIVDESTRKMLNQL